jgi:acyl-CoA synthetase (NDP forming)
MLNARRVAVVGASTDPDKFGGVLLHSILAGGFDGQVFPVNPKASEIEGLPCFSSVSDVPGSLDLVIAVVPGRFVPGILHEAADKRAAGVLVLSGGFGESGRPDLEEEIVGIARERGLRLWGPNTQGVAYAANHLSAVFWPVVRTTGPLAVVGQSGTVVAAISDWALGEGLGLSASLSLGNQADVCDADVLRFLRDDDLTRSVALYLEGTRDGARLVSAVADVAADLPIAVLKCGRTELGRQAVASHTGSLAGSDRVYDGFCRQYGLVRAGDSESLYDAAKILATMRLPKGNRVLMMSSSGGSCALAADEADAQGLVLPVPSADYVDGLRHMGVPEWGSFANPLDIGGISLDHFREAVRMADAEDLADVILLVFGDPIEGADELACELAATSRAAVCAAIYGGAAVETEQRWTMQRSGVPVFPTPERAMRAIGACCWYSRWRDRKVARG